MLETTDLVVVAVTIDVPMYDPGAKYTYLFDATLRSLFPSRYRLYELVASELVLDGLVRFETEPIYTHSKLRVFGDRYVSIGACNVNNRGYQYEGELNVSVLDEGFGRQVRDKVLSDWVGSEWTDALPEDPASVLSLLDEVAAENAARRSWWEENGAGLSEAEAEEEWLERAPSGFLYPLTIPGNYLFDVGPDMF